MQPRLLTWVANARTYVKKPLVGLAATAAIGVATINLFPAWTQAQPYCPLALVLAFDASSSVNAREFRLQTDGIVRALMSTDVSDAIIRSGGLQVLAFEWSGRNQHFIAADWQFLDSLPAIAEFADAIRNYKRQHNDYPTAVGQALGFASIQLQRAPLECDRQTVDVAGDGVHNDGYAPETAYRVFPYGRVTVNALVISGAYPDPIPFYREQVLRGAGAFMEIANGYNAYASAMKRKLLREINSSMVAAK